MLNSTDVVTFSCLNPEPQSSGSDDILHNNNHNDMTVMISVNKYFNYNPGIVYSICDQDSCLVDVVDVETDRQVTLPLIFLYFSSLSGITCAL